MVLAFSKLRPLSACGRAATSEIRLLIEFDSNMMLEFRQQPAELLSGRQKTLRPHGF